MKFIKFFYIFKNLKIYNKIVLAFNIMKILKILSYQIVIAFA